MKMSLFFLILLACNLGCQKAPESVLDVAQREITFGSSIRVAKKFKPIVFRLVKVNEKNMESGKSNDIILLGTRLAGSIYYYNIGQFLYKDPSLNKVGINAALERRSAELEAYFVSLETDTSIFESMKGKFIVRISEIESGAFSSRIENLDLLVLDGAIIDMVRQANEL